VIVDLLPEEPEPRGLLALLQHCQARNRARRTACGRYVPLSEQDCAGWEHSLAASAEGHLAAALSRKSLGHFQVEAAIQSAHYERGVHGVNNWSSVVLLYQKLIQLAPTLGALVSYAGALAECEGAQSGLTTLDSIDVARVSSYQPYWAVKANLLAKLGDHDAAIAAFARARGLSEDPAVRAFLEEQSDKLTNGILDSRSLT